MIRLVLITIFILTAISFSARAGHEVGNGGDVVVCRAPNRNVTSIELLDYYEARTLRKIYYSLGPKELSVEEKLELGIKRLESLSFMTAAKFRGKAKDFEKNAVFLSGIVLVDVPDSAHVAVPKGCGIEQIVVQKNPQFPEDKSYIVNKDLWDLLDTDNRAGLILHEVIYWDAKDSEHRNSIATRYFNSYLTADKFKNFSVRSYIDWLRVARFTYTYHRGMKIIVGYWQNEDQYELSEVEYHTPNLIKKARLPEAGGFPIKGLIVSYDYAQSVEFHDSGTVKTLYGYVSSGNHFSVSVLGGGKGLKVSTMSFDYDGNLEYARMYEVQAFEVGGIEIKLRGPPLGHWKDDGAAVTFHPGFKLKSGFLHAPAKLPHADGTIKEVQPGQIRFDPNGLVVP
ncbi:MAG: hypothetical protein ABL958_08615 [Bdellovibrionia bacterium]